MSLECAPVILMGLFPPPISLSPGQRLASHIAKVQEAPVSSPGPRDRWGGACDAEDLSPQDRKGRKGEKLLAAGAPVSGRLWEFVDSWQKPGIKREDRRRVAQGEVSAWG